MNTATNEEDGEPQLAQAAEDVEDGARDIGVVEVREHPAALEERRE